MAKDSDKGRVLQRRKQELDHALNNAYPPAAVQVRVEKLRAAAIAVLKSNGGPFPTVKGTWGNIAWTTMRARWKALSIGEIVELSSQWGTCQPCVMSRSTTTSPVRSAGIPNPSQQQSPPRQVHEVHRCAVRRCC